MIPVSMGGGLQNALSFLTELKNNSVSFKYLIIIRSSSELHDFCLKNKLSFMCFKGDRWSRLKFELFDFYRFTKDFKPKVIFTIFGNAPIIRSECKVISGFARSNIIEKDVDFWRGLPVYKKKLKIVKDKVILSCIKNCDEVILETPRLVKIAHQNKTFGKAKLSLVGMSPSSLIIKKLREIKSFKDIGGFKKDKLHKILYLSGAHTNKNIHLLPPLLIELAKKGLKVQLVITVPKSDYLTVIEDSFNEYNIIYMLNNLGPIKPGDIPNVIEESSALINVSELESFSNNWVEAWSSERLLICKNSGYARDSCGDSAIYVDFENLLSSVNEIYNTLTKKCLYNYYLESGKTRLLELPSAKEKFEKYIEIIERNL